MLFLTVLSVILAVFTAWKQAYVVPVPKTNPPTDITKDLRPISLTPTVSKVLESFVGQWILNELEGKLGNCHSAVDPPRTNYYN